MTTQLAEAANPLLPNATFFVELIIFVIVLFVLWRYILPPIQNALRERHDMVQRTIDDNREATRLFAAAREKYEESLSEARIESAKIRDEARSHGQAVLEEFRQRAQAEADEVRLAGERQLAEQRDQVLADLHGRVGTLAETLGNRVVGTEVTGHREIVDEYLGGLSTHGGA
ncbi:MAG TPA: F0F1 ATP synthase subunit B [Amycolatopsis sp.]|nr:F0F1 ATP synthase subunit B [Amycolatopsis sp.]